MTVTSFNSISSCIWKNKLLFVQYSYDAEHSGVWLGVWGAAVISNELVKDKMINVEANIFKKKWDSTVVLFSLLLRTCKTSKDIFMPWLEDKSNHY